MYSSSSSLFPHPSLSSHWCSSDTKYLLYCFFCSRPGFNHDEFSALLHRHTHQWLFSQHYRSNKQQCHGTSWTHHHWEDSLELRFWRNMSFRSQNKTLENKTVSLLTLQPVVTGRFQKDLGGGKFLLITSFGLYITDGMRYCGVTCFMFSFEAIPLCMEQLYTIYVRKRTTKFVIQVINICSWT